MGVIVGGGTKVIYVAHVQKESAQPEMENNQAVQRPQDNERGDLVVYYQLTPDFNAFHARCLRVKSDCTVNLGIDFLEESEDKRKEYETQLTSVNEEGQTFQEVISRVSLDYETTGNGYLEIVRSNNNEISELYHAPAINVWRRLRGQEFPFIYRGPDGKEKDFETFQRDPEKLQGSDVGELLHFQNYSNVSRYYGLPDWRGAIPDIEVDYYSVQYNKKFFQNSGVPDLAIITEGGELDSDAEKEVRDFFVTNFKGIENSHRTLYLPIKEEGVKIRFEKLGMESKDKDGSFDKLRARCRDNIVSAHGVPPRLVGIITTGSLGGGGEIEGQLKVFQEVTINPRQDLFEVKLLPVTQGMGIESEWSFAELDTKIQEKDSELYPSLVGSSILTVNEAREAMNYPEKEEEELPEPNPIIVETEEFIETMEKMIEGF